MESEQLVQEIAQAIYDKKGFNIVALDVRGISSMTDFYIVAEGTVERHVQALARIAQEVVKENGGKVVHVEGQESGDWIVVDCWQVVIHFFIPAMRERYRLERLWEEAKLVDLQKALA